MLNSRFILMDKLTATSDWPTLALPELLYIYKKKIYSFSWPLFLLCPFNKCNKKECALLYPDQIIYKLAHNRKAMQEENSQRSQKEEDPAKVPPGELNVSSNKLSMHKTDLLDW